MPSTPEPFSTTRRTVAKGTAAALVGAAAAQLASGSTAAPAGADARSLQISCTIADLEARPVWSDTLVVLVLGYHAIDDGGGGLFYWDPQSNAATDGGTVFASMQSATGRWLRLDF